MRRIHDQGSPRPLKQRERERGQPPTSTGSGRNLVAALNAALDAFEQAEPQFRGPRLAGVDVANGEVRLAKS